MAIAAEAGDTRERRFENFYVGIGDGSLPIYDPNDDNAGDVAVNGDAHDRRQLSPDTEKA